MRALFLSLLLAPSLMSKLPEPPPFLFIKGVQRVEADRDQYRVFFKEGRVVRVVPTAGGYRWTEPDGAAAFYHRGSGGWTTYSRGEVENWTRTYRGYSGPVEVRYEGQSVVTGSGRDLVRFLRSRNGWMAVH
jgi:hypothetical protein